VSARKILEGQAEQYWASDEAQRVRQEPWNASPWEQSRWHFFRFVHGFVLSVQKGNLMGDWGATDSAAPVGPVSFSWHGRGGHAWLVGQCRRCDWFTRQRNPEWAQHFALRHVIGHVQATRTALTDDG